MAKELGYEQQLVIPWHAYGLLAVGIVCLTLGTFLVRWAGVSGPASSFYRLLFAALVLVPLWFARRPAVLPTRRSLLWATIAGVFFALDLVLWNTSALMTSMANAALFGNTAPIWVGLGALLLLREQLPARFWQGMLVAMLGAAIIFGAGGMFGSAGNLGDLLALIAGAFYGGYLLAIQQARVRLDTLSGLTLVVVTGVALMFVLCLALGTPLGGYSARSWAALVGLGLIPQVIGAFAINYALGHLRATVVSVTMLAQPVLSALFAVPLFGELLGPAQIGGGALVLAGIYLVTNIRGGRREA
jgi:drug/metabolite transporter (DMT)-like permease